jgi:hypothetical protein
MKVKIKANKPKDTGTQEKPDHQTPQSIYGQHVNVLEVIMS